MENELVLFDPTNEYYKSTTGAVPQGEAVTFRLSLDKIIAPSHVTLHVFDEQNNSHDFSMWKTDGERDVYQTQVSLCKGLYMYYFVLDGVQHERFIGRLGNKAVRFYENVNPWQLSVYDRKYKVPKWFCGSTMYQVFPDRFCKKGKVYATDGKVLHEWGEEPLYKDANGEVKNNDYFGGNFEGIVSKLDYLHSLGVKVLYLNPVFKAGSNHRYDTEDFEQIDPMLGNEQDFVNLCDEAKKKGIRIVLDGVFNHAGSSSKYFDKEGKYGCGAYHNESSPYRKWFNFGADNSYESWWGIQTLPRFSTDKAVEDYFCGENGIVAKWLKAGASGWRLDVVDELSAPFVDALVERAKKVKKDALIIGEVWEDASNKVAYGKRCHYFEGSQLDSTMNYPLRNAIISFVRYGDVSTLNTVVFDQLNNYPKDVLNCEMNILGTHDTERLLNALVGADVNNLPREQMGQLLSQESYAEGIKLVKMASALQFTFYGVPCVYYGDEVGMQGYLDPYCRRCFPNEANGELLAYYQKLGKLRKKKVFAQGKFTQLTAENGLYVFSRSNEKDYVLVASSKYADVALKIDGKYKNMIDGTVYEGYCLVQKNSTVILQKMS